MYAIGDIEEVRRNLLEVRQHLLRILIDMAEVEKDLTRLGLLISQETEEAQKKLNEMIEGLKGC